MTDVGTEFTPEAETRLGEYLRQVREVLAGLPDVNPDEIEADVREHVANELRAVPRPIGPDALAAVLARLGPPDQWAAGDRPDPLRRAGYLIRERVRGVGAAVGDRLRRAWDAISRGPEDWRLAYLTFGVFALGVVVLPIFPICLGVSYFLGRAGIAHAREKGIGLAARRWLLYPPVVIVSLKLFVGLVLAPPFVTTGVIIEQVDQRDRQERWELIYRSRADERVVLSRDFIASHPEATTSLDRTVAPFPGNREVQRVLATLFLGAGLVAFWGVVVGSLGGLFPGAVRAVFCPLCDRFRGKHGWWLAGSSLVGLVVWAGWAYDLAADAGLLS
jgi:hypothetical protein